MNTDSSIDNDVLESARAVAAAIDARLAEGEDIFDLVWSFSPPGSRFWLKAALPFSKRLASLNTAQ